MASIHGFISLKAVSTEHDVHLYGNKSPPPDKNPIRQKYFSWILSHGTQVVLVVALLLRPL